MDYSKAFDTMNHDIFIKIKLALCKLDNHSIMLFRNSLSDRAQMVKMDQ